MALAIAARLLLAPEIIAAVDGPTATAPALTAAFLFNFAKFTEWPPDVLTDGQRLILCVSDDDLVAEALAQTIEGHNIAGHPLEMTIVRAATPLRSCHMLFVGVAQLEPSVAMLSRVGDASIFTVGRVQQFAARGGIGELIVDRDRMRFAINLGSAQRARLRISSRLLSLAQIVKG